MGLDMFALTTTEKPACEVDFENQQHDQLHYLRKHPDLHGWMEKLYRDKGGSADSFACLRLALMASDLNLLEADIRARRLPPTEGFFFGESQGLETEDDLAFVAKARQAIAAGLTVYYTSWW